MRYSDRPLNEHDTVLGTAYAAYVSLINLEIVFKDHLSGLDTDELKQFHKLTSVPMRTLYRWREAGPVTRGVYTA